MTENNSFSSKVNDLSRPICLYGIVPPPQRISKEKVEMFAVQLAERIGTLQGCDGLIVYDIQDEKGRTEEQRPFPFSNTHEPRYYAKLITSLTGIESILYRAVADAPKEGFEEWLVSTREVFGVKNLVLVGSSCSAAEYPGYSVKEASQRILDHNIYSDYCLGGITIAERHRDKGIEHEILHSKANHGLSFFTSQLVYNADNAITLLMDYDSLCKEKGCRPSRIIIAFAPFGSEETVKFMKWLGVELPLGTVRRVLSRSTPQARINESIEICCENLKRIFEVTQKYQIHVPIGFTVECVSKNKDEGEGALTLFGKLKTIVESYYPTTGQTQN